MQIINFMEQMKGLDKDQLLIINILSQSTMNSIIHHLNDRLKINLIFLLFYENLSDTMTFKLLTYVSTKLQRQISVDTLKSED